MLPLVGDMSEAVKCWTGAKMNGWNASSMSRNWRHCLWHFNRRYSNEWIRPLPVEEKRRSRGLWENFPESVYALDGSMFRRRMTASQALPQGIVRADYYDHKHDRPESVNVQCVTTATGIAPPGLTGVPGRMPDINAGRNLLDSCNSFDRHSVLTDQTYSHYDERLITSDDTPEHAAARAVAEFKFGSVESNYNMVGGTYRRASEWHNAAIRAAFILDNMKKVFGGNDE